MTIKVYVPAMLRARCGVEPELSFDAPDLRHLLTEIERLHPELHRGICHETGAVRQHINLFVNTLNSRDCEGLDTRLTNGDVVTILPAVSGG